MPGRAEIDLPRTTGRFLLLLLLLLLLLFFFFFFFEPWFGDLDCRRSLMECISPPWSIHGYRRKVLIAEGLTGSPWGLAIVLRDVNVKEQWDEFHLGVQVQ